MKRSLSFKLTGAIWILLALLLALITSLEFERFNSSLDRQILNEMHNDIARLFSSQRKPVPPARDEDNFEELHINWPGRLIDGVICASDGRQLWQDIQLLKGKLGDNLCPELMAQLDRSDTFFNQITLPNQQSVFLYSLRVSRFLPHLGHTTFHIMLLRPAERLLHERHAEASSLVQRAILIYIAMAALLWLATRWGLRSLQRMQNQLEAIRQQQRPSLSDDFERELLPLTRSLNLLLDNERQQTSRYQHTMHDLAHSLKTRLALIQATMASEQLSARARRGLDEQVRSMDQIVQYHLRRAVAGRQLLSSQGCDPVPILQKLLATMARVYQQKPLQIDVEFDDEVQFAGDEDDLFELLGNLLDNAHKFAISQISIALRRRESWLVLVLEDDGPGIPPAQRERVLQRGVRPDNSSGQGIGLCVSHEIIASYNGDLAIDDSPLGGARFTIRLPATDISG